MFEMTGVRIAGSIAVAVYATSDADVDAVHALRARNALVRQHVRFECGFGVITNAGGFRACSR
jgi:hypothetical protein